MRRVFVDTSAFVALRHSDEREHTAAHDCLRSLAAEGVAFFTSNYVVAETYTTLLIRVGHAVAIEWGRQLRAGESFEVVRADEAIDERAWEILDTHSDKRWSYVDASSFAILEREGSREAFAFDRHFTQRGLTVLPAG